MSVECVATGLCSHVIDLFHFYYFQIANIKKTLAAQSGSGVQEADMLAGISGSGNSEREALPLPPDAKKKQHKGKGIRGSSRFWKT